MAETRVVIGTEKGPSFKVVLPEGEISKLRGKKIGDTFPGDLVGVAGYEFKITGGTDINGNPLRSDLPGVTKKPLLLSDGPGYKPTEPGIRHRKMIRGNTIDEDIAQLNVVVVKTGGQPLEKLLGAEKAGEGEKTE
ncbi:MAG TPA: 30S ribosomal protein S6e [archaeon]|nr:30S ribosomal protein S6e [archaeon]